MHYFKGIDNTKLTKKNFLKKKMNCIIREVTT